MVAQWSVALILLAGPVLAQSTQPAELIERLGDRSPAVRQAAIEQLRAIGPAALPLLRRALRGDDPQIASAAAEVMRQLPRTRPGDSPDITSAITRVPSLIALGTPEASAAVYRLILQNPDAAERWEIVRQVQAAQKLPPIPWSAADFADDDGALACAAAASRKDADPAEAVRLYAVARPLMQQSLAALPEEQVRPHIGWNIDRAAAANDVARQIQWLRLSARLSPAGYRPGRIPVDVAELYRLVIDAPNLPPDSGDAELFAPYAGRPIMLYGAARIADRRRQPLLARFYRALARSLVSLTPSQHFDVGQAMSEMRWYDDGITELLAYTNLPWPFRANRERYSLMRSYLTIADTYAGRFEHATASPYFLRCAEYVEDGVTITVRGHTHRGTAAADEVRRMGHYNGLCGAIRTRDWPLADRHETALVRLNTAEHHVLQVMAWNATRAGREADALKHFAATADELSRQMLADPGNASAINNVAWFFACSGRRLDEALILAHTAVAIEPNGYHLDTLAEVLHQLGRTQEAVELEHKALALRPDDYVLKVQLQRFERRIGSMAVERSTPSPQRGEGWGEGRNVVR